MSTKYEIRMGCDCPHIDQEAAEDLARHLCADAFPAGHSIRVEQGCWAMANGTIVHENTVVCTWYATDQQKANGEAHARVNRLAAQYKELARQEAVMVTTEEVFTVLV